MKSADSRFLALLAFIVGAVRGEADEEGLLIQVKEDPDAPDETAFLQRILPDIQAGQVSLSYTGGDGREVRVLVDEARDAAFVGTELLGEEELGQAPRVFLCFAILSPGYQLLLASSIAKLKQRRAGVRTAEEERGWDGSSTSPHRNVSVHSSTLARLFRLQPQSLTNLCPDARFRLSLADAHALGIKLPGEEGALGQNGGDDEGPGLEDEISEEATTGLTNCGALSTAPSEPCLCTHRLRLPWYPCGWKLCRNSAAHVPDSGDFLAASVRCGIRSCTATHALLHRVSSRRHCFSIP